MDEQDGCATIVVAQAVTKLDALTVIAGITGSAVEGAGTTAARVVLADGVRVQIDIPKFGEPPPLALDVWSTRGAVDAQKHALTLAALLQERAGWSVQPAFPVDPPLGPGAAD